ncbi:MAG: hypothetical protein U9Q73_00455 [Nanoarchaeota archaeon]|nr:hypothetical protein [Nanoarchaeota archaeon]
MTIKEMLSFIPATGEGLSWTTQKVIQFIAQYGVDLTILQSKLILLLVFGIIIYALFSVITIAKKLLKWGLIALVIFLATSVAISLFA